MQNKKVTKKLTVDEFLIVVEMLNNAEKIGGFDPKTMDLVHSANQKLKAAFDAAKDTDGIIKW